VKKQLVFGMAIVISGLLIAFGPQFLFKICSVTDSIPQCYWTAQAEIGLGLLIAALGLCFIAFNNLQTRLGLIIGIFLSGIIVLFIPHALIGGCEMKNMTCHRVAFPAITVIGAVLLTASALYVIFTEIKKAPANNPVA
jgi:hypothetical protein